MAQKSKSAGNSVRNKPNFQGKDQKKQRGESHVNHSNPAPRKISEARLAAFEILLKIERDKAFSSVLLPLYEEKLKSAADRALCHQLTLGVLRGRIYLDYLLQKFIKPKIEKLDAEVLTALRLGAYQLLSLDKIPAFAAINESVNLVRHFKKTSAGGLVNAVLRKIEREKNDFRFDFSGELEKLSVETSHPLWLIENWSKSFGFEETAKLARANNETPVAAFRLTAKSGENTIGILKKLGLEIQESVIAPGAFRVSRTGEMLRAFAGEGKIYFQEESSQLVAHAVSLRAGESFLDVCAAPGSKTTLVAMKNAESGRIVAGDKHFHRLRVLRKTCELTGASAVEIAAYDAEQALPFADESFDSVLVDAPCSGTGTIRHNPEIRYFLTPEALAELPDKQLKILTNASKVLKKGGRLIYSTCSLETTENEAVAERFLAQNPNFYRISLDLPRQFLTAEGFARTFPHRDETDGFFIAAFEKN